MWYLGIMNSWCISWGAWNPIWLWSVVKVVRFSRSLSLMSVLGAIFYEKDIRTHWCTMFALYPTSPVNPVLFFYSGRNDSEQKLIQIHRLYLTAIRGAVLLFAAPSLVCSRARLLVLLVYPMKMAEPRVWTNNRVTARLVECIGGCAIERFLRSISQKIDFHILAFSYQTWTTEPENGLHFWFWTLQSP